MCVASVEFLSTSVSTVIAPGGHWWVCFSCCGLSPAVGLCGRLKRADKSLWVATEGSLISQIQSQINGLVSGFRRSVFSDNERQSRQPLGQSFFKTQRKKQQLKEKVNVMFVEGLSCEFFFFFVAFSFKEAVQRCIVYGLKPKVNWTGSLEK